MRVLISKGRLVAAAVVLYAGIAALPSPGQALEAVGGLVLIDGNGEPVGTMLGLNHVVLTNGQGALGILEIERSGGPNETKLRGPGPLYFETTDCTGSAYVEPWYPTDPRGIVGAEPGLPVYVVEPGSPIRSIEVRSSFSNNSCAIPGRVISQDLFPAISITDLSTQSPPPYSVVPLRTASCCGDCDGSGNVTVDEIVTTVDAALHGCSSAPRSR